VKKITIDDIAKKAGVSKGTVSAVLNQKSIVQTKTRDSVLKAMKELNYRPRGNSRSVKKASVQFQCIGLLIRELDNPFYTGIALGVREYANSRGYLVLTASSEGDHIYEEEITESFTAKDIKGAIIAPVLEGTAEIEHLFRLKMMNFPFVLLENIKSIQANAVSIDNVRVMKEALKYLMDNGHSKIIHFAGPRHASHTFERIDGFRRAYGESNFAFNSDMIIHVGAHLEDGYKACLDYFQNRSRENFPTAIVCYNDLVALGVMSALSQMNIKVPDEISIVGNDDIPFSTLVPVDLTTIRAPLFELGRKAAEILINNIESPSPLPIVNTILNAEFIVRVSTKPVPFAQVSQPMEISQASTRLSPDETDARGLENGPYSLITRS
jgi:LacI family transcriptional regulator